MTSKEQPSPFHHDGQSLLKRSEPWPAKSLEDLGHCPVCGHRDRRLVYDDLHDNTFFCAPGIWSLWQCVSCGTGYLDPRPTPSTIGLAYSTYYTHSSAEENQAIGFIQSIKIILSNGYKNYRFGTKLEPSSWLGMLALYLLPTHRANIHAEMRNLPLAHSGSRLLDVGCGDGRFLEQARSAGWSVVGTETDPKAAVAARHRDLDIREGSIDVLDPRKEQFDGITLNHVIEHVHDPTSYFRACNDLLRPGGWIWVETPNMEALGHKRYGKHWRGLEPPRHLVLLNQNSLESSLHDAGFREIEKQPYRRMTEWFFKVSELLQIGSLLPRQKLSPAGRQAARQADAQAALQPRLREVLTMKAWKK